MWGRQEARLLGKVAEEGLVERRVAARASERAGRRWAQSAESASGADKAALTQAWGRGGSAARPRRAAPGGRPRKARGVLFHRSPLPHRFLGEEPGALQCVKERQPSVFDDSLVVVGL